MIMLNTPEKISMKESSAICTPGGNSPKATEVTASMSSDAGLPKPLSDDRYESIGISIPQSAVESPKLIVEDTKATIEI